LVWFQGIQWVEKQLQVGEDYLVFGRVSFFQGMPQITHPDVEPYTLEHTQGKGFLEPVYPTTEKLKAKNLGARQIGKLTWALLQQVDEWSWPENLPQPVLTNFQLLPRFPRQPCRLQCQRKKIKI
jgi:ATP-dependent DNA helicase RecG